MLNENPATLRERLHQLQKSTHNIYHKSSKYFKEELFISNFNLSFSSRSSSNVLWVLFFCFLDVLSAANGRVHRTCCRVSSLHRHLRTQRFSKTMKPRWSMWKHRSFFSNAKNNQNKQRLESTTNNKRSVFITINSILVGLNKHLIAFKFDDIHVFMPIFFLFFSTKQRLCGEQNETLLIWVMDGAQQTSPSKGDREWANNRTGNSSQHHRANASYRIAGIVWWFTRPSTLNVELK